MTQREDLDVLAMVVHQQQAQQANAFVTAR
jgi:hypothetical protein